MTLNTDMKNTSDLTDSEIQTVLNLVGTHIAPIDVRLYAGMSAYKSYILLTRSLKVSHPEMFKDPDVEAVRAILDENYSSKWVDASDATVKDHPAYKAYMAGKAAQ